ncbi:MAG: 50S ribosomal protein L31 [Anaerolineae bacterium]|nr:50S ribosomal protein L31 [Thermoflexales bacterium]MDW8396732.1 50S ribosomal protein L31 [Anaerolineae bacterium]
MKKDIHPRYYPEAKIYVGGVFVGTVGSTRPELHLDVWSGNHPFFTGEQRIIDTEGQVDRFQKRLERKVDNLVDKAEKQRRRRAKRQIAEIVDEEPAETPAQGEAES